MTTIRTASIAAIAALALPAAADLAVSANDHKVRLDDGTVKIVANAPADTVSIIDLAASPPRVVAEIQAPAPDEGRSGGNADRVVMPAR